MTRTRTIVVALFALVASVAAPARGVVGVLDVSLDGPTGVVPGASVAYGGVVSALGIGAPAQRVELLVDGAVAGSTTTSPTGEYSISTSFATPGTYSVQAVAQRDTVLEARSRTVNVVALAYTLTVATTGTGGGVVTSNPAGIFCGADCSEEIPAATTVSLTALPAADSAFVSWSGDCSGTGACSVTMDGPRSVVATFADVQAPDVPALSGTIPASPANENAPVVAGTAEPASTVRLFTNSTCAGASTASGTTTPAGGFTIGVAVSDDSSTTFHANATDGAGNTSGCSGGLTYVEDSTVPTAPVLTGTSPGSPANHNAPAVMGDAEPGATVRLYASAACAGSPIATGSAPGGAFTIPIDVADDSTTQITARATDAAGNAGGCSNAIAYIEDSTAPLAPVLTGTTPSSPANHNSPMIEGTAESGVTVEVFSVGSCAGLPDGNAIASGGTFAVPVTVADNSVTTFRARARDAAGNTSPCSSSSVTYIEDSIVPGAPEFTGSTPDSPANDNSPVIQGTAEAGSLVRVYSTDNCTGALRASGTVPSSGIFAFSVSVGNDTTTTFRATARDGAGNTSPCSSSSLTYVEDSTAPAAPVFLGSSPASPANHNAPVLDGTAEPLADIEIFASAACAGSPATTGVAGTTGAFSSEVAVGDDTITTFSARAIDAAGNVGACSDGLVFVEDSTAPAAPEVTGIAPASPANDNAPVVMGTAEPGVSVSVHTDADCTSAVAGTGNAAGGAFTIGVNVANDSTTTFWARATDAAGNVGACSATSVTYVEDSIPPARPTMGGSTPQSPANNNNPTIWGTTEAGALVRLHTNATCTSAVVAEGTATGGSFAISISVADDTTATYWARAADAAGNLSACSASGVKYTEDSTPPVLWSLGATVISDTRINLTWGPPHDEVSPANQTFIEVCRSTDPDTCANLFTVNHLFNGAATGGSISGLSPNTRYFLVVRARDAAGNRSSGHELTHRTHASGVVRSIAAGGQHTCAAISDGTVQCWGDNAAGQVGDNSTTIRTTPTKVNLGTALSTAAGPGHSCMVSSPGWVSCWGWNSKGQVGNGNTVNQTAPVTLAGIGNAIAVSAGGEHTCVLLVDGTVRCWGENGFGQLGDGTTTDRLTPVAVVGLTGVKEISAGNEHTCALRADGTLRCWGKNHQGQLGDAGAGLQSELPVFVPGVFGAISIAAGGLHTCAAMSDGGARCWGNNSWGQLGDGTFASRANPGSVSGMNDPVRIVAGHLHTCALRATGSARCWGDNSSGQLGISSGAAYANVATPVSGLTLARAMSAGSYHTCAVRGDGTSRCWGWNGFGQLGNGTTTNVPTATATPAIVPSPLGTRSVATGGNHSCAALNDGTGRCWGHGDSGQLGNGASEDRLEPVVVVGLSNATKIVAGTRHSCALVADGTVRCWGGNSLGQVGDGTTVNRSTPVAVSGISGAKDIAADKSFTCAALDDGSVRCWGGTPTVTTTTPVAVTGIVDAISVGTGGAFVCVTRATGAVQCWGSNQHGQLGNGSTTPSSTPVTVIGLGGSAMSVDGGTTFTCALLPGTVRCWGLNNAGQLGNGTNTNSSQPVSVSLLATAVDGFNLGGEHACVFTATGAGKCWGEASQGQLGNGTTIDRSTPQDVGLSRERNVASAEFHSCAGTFSLVCWGQNWSGQIGDGSTAQALTPRSVKHYP